MDDPEHVEHSVCSAPGKVILFGEHAVVYGKPALACSVGLRTYCHVRRSLVRESGPDARFLTFRRPDVLHEASWTRGAIASAFAEYTNGSCGTGSQIAETMQVLRSAASSACSSSSGGGDDDMAAVELAQDTGIISLLFALLELLKQSKVRLEDVSGPLSVCVASEIPIGVGMGSSAAFSAALIGGLSRVFEPRCFAEMELQQQLEHLNALSYQLETLNHGPGASGIDNSIATFGNSIRFCKTDEKRVRPLSSTASKNLLQLSFVIVNTRQPGNTQTLIGIVRDLHTSFPSVIGPILDSIGAISERALSTLQTEQLPICQLYSVLEELVRINHLLLNAIGVGHGKVEQLQCVARQLGVTGKITGAGGGGCMLFLMPQGSGETERAVFLERLEAAGGQCFQVSLAVPGLTHHGSDQLCALPAAIRDRLQVEK